LMYIFTCISRRDHTRSWYSTRFTPYAFRFTFFISTRLSVALLLLLLKVMAENKNTSTLSGSGCAAVECYSSFFSPSQWWRRVFWIPMFTIVLLFFHGQFLRFSLWNIILLYPPVSIVTARFSAYCVGADRCEIPLYLIILLLI
jgi:hypothetical protein